MEQFARTSTVKQRPTTGCVCVCVCVGLGTCFKMAHCCSWKPKQGMVITSELNKERRWNNDEFSWQISCCLSLDVPQLSFEWVGTLCVCLPVREGGLRWTLFLLFMVMCFACYDPHCDCGPAVGFMGKQASATSSKLQSIPVLSPFIEGVLTFEFSDFCFCSTFCRRGMWDLGRSKDLFIMQTPVCSPDLLK